MRARVHLAGVAVLLACGPSLAADAGLDSGSPQDAGPPPDVGPRLDASIDPRDFVDPSAFEYEWTCTGEVAADGPAPDRAPPSEDCSAGVWPDLDSRRFVCPTVTDARRDDPVSGLTLPLEDTRALPLDIEVSESGSFLPPDAPTSWPSTMRVVVWNTEYTRNLDAQLETLTTHPDLRDADLYLLSEVDRCSSRNGERRAARLLAQAIGGAYVYGVEFVELSIGRTQGGDTGQAIVSRRPLRGARLTCHSAQSDWFASEDEPRLGSRVALHADVPIGDTFARVFAVHLESNDVFGERRAVQSKEMLDAAQAAACERATIFAGDFNAWYWTAPELTVLRNEGFEDAFDTLNDTGGTHRSGRRLDYAWVRGLVVVDGAILRDVDTSDHAPMWLDVALP